MIFSLKGGFLSTGCMAVLFLFSQSVQAQASALPDAVPLTDLEYHSAFKGYQALREPKRAPWKEANDTVGRIGGWRVYAREVHQMQHGHGTNTEEAHRAVLPAEVPDLQTPPAEQGGVR